MENPRKRTTVTTAAGRDGLHLFDHQKQQAYALNTTSALVWQHCDGRTTPEELMELMRQNRNVSRAQAEQLTWLALDELGKANLLEDEVTRPHPLSSKLTRRQIIFLMFRIARLIQDILQESQIFICHAMISTMLVVVRHLFYASKIMTDFTQTYQTTFQ